jgi:4-phytase/acid phosphatase
MELFGSYYRGYFSSNGLLAPTGCEDADRIHIRADVDARTRDTGRALASGMMPGCNVDVGVASGKDPLFSPLSAGIGEPDRALAVVSIAGRIGENPSAFIATYRYAFDTLREVLFGCAPSSPCPAEKESGKQTILDQPSRVETATGGHAADIQGPLKIGSNLSEALLLEYANGMEGRDLGWGRLTSVKLLEINRRALENRGP